MLLKKTAVRRRVPERRNAHTGHCNFTCCDLITKDKVVFLFWSTILNTKEQQLDPDLSLSFSRVLALCVLIVSSCLQLIICTRWQIEGEVGFSKRQAALTCVQLSSVELAQLILENSVKAQQHIREHALRSFWKRHRSQPPAHLRPDACRHHRPLPVPSSPSTFGGPPCPFGRFNQCLGEAKSFHGTLYTQKCQCVGPRK